MPQRGSAVVEFALVLPLVLAVLLGIAEVAVTARAQLELVAAAREGARQAATHPDPARAVAAVRTALGTPLGAEARVTVRRPHVVGQPATVRVTVRRAVAAPVFGGFAIELCASASMRVER